MARPMAIRNRVKDFISEQGVTPYQFAEKIGVSRNTIYSLCNKPEQIPKPVVLDKICETFPGTQPGDLIYYVPARSEAA